MRVSRRSPGRLLTGIGLVCGRYPFALTASRYWGSRVPLLPPFSLGAVREERQDADQWFPVDQGRRPVGLVPPAAKHTPRASSFPQAGVPTSGVGPVALGERSRDGPSPVMRLIRGGAGVISYSSGQGSHGQVAQLWSLPQAPSPTPPVQDGCYRRTPRSASELCSEPGVDSTSPGASGTGAPGVHRPGSGLGSLCVWLAAHKKQQLHCFRPFRNPCSGRKKPTRG